MISDTSFLLIGTLAIQANTTKDTVRHYDGMGLLKSRKRQAGSRLYTEFHPECVERINMIKNAQAIGFSLKELKSSLNDYFDGILDVDQQMILISKKIAQAEQQQANLLSVVSQLSAHHKYLEEMKSDKIDILSKGKEKND